MSDRARIRTPWSTPVVTGSESSVCSVGLTAEGHGRSPLVGLMVTQMLPQELRPLATIDGLCRAYIPPESAVSGPGTRRPSGVRQLKHYVSSAAMRSRTSSRPLERRCARA